MKKKLNDVTETFSHPELGSVYVVGKEEIEAGGYGTWEFVYTVGKKPIPPGGGIEIVFNTSYPTNTWSIPQTYDSVAPGYTTAILQGAGNISLRVIPVPEKLQRYSLGCHIIQGLIEGATLFHRDVIKITYGNTSYGSIGAQAQIMAREVDFPIFVDTEGKPDNKILNQASWFRVITRLAPVRKIAHLLPKIKVVGGKAKYLKVKAPMVVEENEPFDLRVVACDTYSNLASDYEGTMRIELIGGEGDGFPIDYTFTEEDDSAREFKDLKIGRAGVVRIFVEDSGNKVAGVSNPIKVVEDGRKQPIFWGEIHGHTELSDGNGSIDEHYQHARYVACLDFASTVDHINYNEGDFGKEKWEITKRKASEYDDPPHFATLLGYEPGIATPEGDHAHMNVYCESPDVPLVPTRGEDGRELWKLAKKFNLIIVPHHTGYGANNLKLTAWSPFEQEFTPVVEIYSAHGCSEYLDNPRRLVDQTPGSFYQDALAKGYKFGAIASSDYHQAFTGQDIKLQEYPGNLNCSHFQYRAGYVAVLTEELSRRAILEAIRTRRCYATTGERIYLNFTIDGNPMGSELEAERGQPIKIYAEAAGTNRLYTIEIIKDNQIFYAFRPNGMEGSITLKDENDTPSISYYYMRVRQIDGETAWSSPIWVKRIG